MGYECQLLIIICYAHRIVGIGGSHSRVRLGEYRYRFRLETLIEQVMHYYHVSVLLQSGP